MMSYIIQIIFLQLVFLFFYELVFKKETFYQWNRVYLIASSLLAVILPFVRFKTLTNVIPQDYIYRIPEITLNANNELIENSLISAKQTIHIPYLKIVYFIGVSLAVLLFLKRLIKLLILIKRNKTIAENGYTLVLLKEEKNAFSFLNYIFIHKSYLATKKLHIIQHELVHIKQKHTWDLLYFEFIKIVFWFNPAVYIYQKRIQEIHEFLTDAIIIKQVDKRTYFNLLLNEVFSTENIAFTNSFYNYSLIKKRIIMATKTKSKKVRLAKYLLLIPILATTLIYTSCKDEKTEPEGIKTITTKDGLTITEDSNSNIVTFEGKDGLKFTFNTETQKIEVVSKNHPTTTTIISTEKNGVVPFNTVDEAPIFPGCENASDSKACFIEKTHQHVRDNFHYPQEAKSQGVQGRVYVNFIIDTDGTVKNIRTRGPNAVLEDEAKRIINLLPHFTPGKNNGKAVKVPFSLPITFKLD